MDMQSVLQIASVIGGALGTGAAGTFFRLWKKEVRSAKRDPVFRNGDLAGVRAALTLLGESCADNSGRIAALELQARAGDRTHLDFQARLISLEGKVTELWARR